MHSQVFTVTPLISIGEENRTFCVSSDTSAREENTFAQQGSKNVSW